MKRSWRCCRRLLHTWLATNQRGRVRQVLNLCKLRHLTPGKLRQVAVLLRQEGLSRVMPWLRQVEAALENQQTLLQNQVLKRLARTIKLQLRCKVLSIDM